MKRTVSYALRSLVGPWLIVVVIGLEIATFVMRGMPWRGEGMWTVDFFAIPLFIIGPLCAGVAAVDASRLSRPGNIHLILSIPRPQRAYVRAAAWCAGPVAMVHSLTILAAIVVGDVEQPSVGWLALLGACAVQVLSIFWFAALGSAIGRFLNPLVAGLVSGTVAFGCHYFLGNALSGSPTFRLLDLGGATITMIGKAYSGGYLTGQAATFIVTSALLLVVPVRVRPGFRVPGSSGVAAVIAVVLALVVGPSAFPEAREVADPRPPTYCQGARPQICLYFEHRRYSSLVIPTVRSLTEAASRSGYAALVPDRVVESSRTFRPDGPGTMPLWSQHGHTRRTGCLLRTSPPTCCSRTTATTSMDRCRHRWSTRESSICATFRYLRHGCISLARS